MPFKSDAQRRWMYANEPEMAKRWQEHTPKGKDLPERVGKKDKKGKKKKKRKKNMNKKAILTAVQFLVKSAKPTPKTKAQKLDELGMGRDALQAYLQQNFREAWNKSPLLHVVKQRKEIEEAERQDRIRRLKDEMMDQGSHLDPRVGAIMFGENPNAPMGPAAPGSPDGMAGPPAPGLPTAPSNHLGMGGDSAPVPPSLADALKMNFNAFPKFGSVAQSVLRKYAEGAEAEEEHEEGEMESGEEESEESLPPEVMGDLVNYIQSMGQGIDDAGFHQKAESHGIDPHEAEEEVYRLLAALVGGQNDVVPGGLSAGMPTSAFPQDQIEKGTEVELEHTSNPAIATEIAKDHLVEGEDYYDPRLEDLEKGMETAKENGDLKGVKEDSPKAKKNTKRKEKDVENLKASDKKAAFKYGFYTKVAEAGLKPSEAGKLFEKTAQRTLTAEALHGLIGAAKFLAMMGFLIPTVGVPLLGAGAGTAAYAIGREPDLDPEELKHVERIALYNRLAGQSHRRARLHGADKKKYEGETQADDAHKKVLPLPAKGGIEI